mmetsp:Transcript_40539/g.82813  ORF Transcript_40539/g.82813 Transcript_40539/m.82813 type:complete len:231 (+) Transcript_40539:171-863(+)
MAMPCAQPMDPARRAHRRPTAIGRIFARQLMRPKAMEINSFTLPTWCKRSKMRPKKDACSQSCTTFSKKTLEMEVNKARSLRHPPSSAALFQSWSCSSYQFATAPKPGTSAARSRRFSPLSTAPKSCCARALKDSTRDSKPQKCRVRTMGARGQAQLISNEKAKCSVTGISKSQRYACTGRAPSVNQSACSSMPNQKPGLRKIDFRSSLRANKICASIHFARSNKGRYNK